MNVDEKLRDAINEWKARFERIRWETFARMSEAEQKRAMDHALDGYILGTGYPFIKRPAECELWLSEIQLALWASEGDFDEAAIRLRVSSDRLRQAIKNVPELRKYIPGYGYKERSEGKPLVDVILRDGGFNLTIKIAKLSNSDYTMSPRMEGDTIIIDLDRTPSTGQKLRTRRLYERAEEILGKGPK